MPDTSLVFPLSNSFFSLPALVSVANWLDVMALAVGRRARTFHDLLHGAPRGKGTIQEAKKGEMNEINLPKSNEWMLEAACDVWRRIPTMLRLTGMWLLMPETTSLGTGGRDWQMAHGTGSEGGQHSGAGVDGPCVPTRPKPPSRAKENEMSKAG